MSGGGGSGWCIKSRVASALKVELKDRDSGLKSVDNQAPNVALRFMENAILCGFRMKNEKKHDVPDQRRHEDRLLQTGT